MTNWSFLMCKANWQLRSVCVSLLSLVRKVETRQEWTCNMFFSFSHHSSSEDVTNSTSEKLAKFTRRNDSINKNLHIVGQLTCLCAYTTLPRSFHVPPRRSIRTILRIWKKRRPRSVVAANICPDVPIPITINDAEIVIKSVKGREEMF